MLNRDVDSTLSAGQGHSALIGLVQSPQDRGILTKMHK